MLRITEPNSYNSSSTEVISDKYSTTYQCINSENNEQCECSDYDCSGNQDFCKIRHCILNSTCHCSLTYHKTELLAIFDDKTVTNPLLITFTVCYFKKPAHSNRQLLELETAKFTNNNITIVFKDPILTLPAQGKVILRSPDFEHLITVPQDLMVIIPFEFLAFKTSIDIIYLHPSGQAVTGQINVAGKTICQMKPCILCTTALHHIKCLPIIIQYAIYTIAIFLGLLALACLKLFLKSFIFMIIIICKLILGLGKILKFIARCALLIGAYIGSTFREILQRTFNNLELHAQRTHVPMLPLIILLCACVPYVENECTTHDIIKSDLKSCEPLPDGTKQCHVQTTAEITLKTLLAESCLYFTDLNNNHLFTISIKLDAVVCTHNTQRLYFTFPVKTRQVSQISCTFNEQCGRGVHCLKKQIGKSGLRFEAETPESRTHMGFSACIAATSGSGCWLHRASCAFYRIWYEPDLLKSYEVSRITGHQCQYQISIKQTENETISQLSITDSAYTKNGIKITVLGAFNQPQINLHANLVQRVGNKNEAYLVQTCDRNHPVAGKIGAVQANTSFTTDFIFDPDLTQCDFFENTLRCSTAADALDHITRTKENALPLQSDVHLFHTKENTLQSTLLISSAVKIQLYFRDYKIAVKSVTICPHFDDSTINVQGCYKCSVLSRLSIKAHSTCHEGIVAVQFQRLKVFTQAIHLTTEPTQHIIKFHADEKCYSEKLCLQSPTIIQCQTLDFCLHEPSVELLQLDLNYTNSMSSQSPYNFWDSIQFPKLTSTFFIFKYIGSILLIFCLSITAISTIITCCCRAR